MKKSVDLIDALNQVSQEKGLDKEVIYEAIEASLMTACKKNFGTSQNIRVVFNRETGEVKVFAQKEVTKEVTDPHLEISLEDARKIKMTYEYGDIVDVVVTPRNFGRVSAQNAKQLVMQKFREAERTKLYNEYITKERDIVSGTVQRREHRNVYIALRKIDAILGPHEQIPGEAYEHNERLKVYVLEVKQGLKGPVIHVSRTHPEFVKRLFEQEVPEIYEGIVEIKSISREAGSRSKLAVRSNSTDVDPVGACVGQNGSRVNVVVSELRGEKIDVIQWSDDPRQYIASALSPSRVLEVLINPDEQTSRVVVPDNQLSLAIGKDGQNARLAAKLTGWRIDIKSETQARELEYLEEDEYIEEEYLEEEEGTEEEYYEEDYEPDMEPMEE